MTTFGPDLASYEQGEDITKLPNTGFVIAKATESNGYVDPAYESWRAAAKATGMLFIPYHFLVQGVSAAAQAAQLAAHIGDKSLPVMLDVETEGSSKPTLADILAFIDAAAALGIRVKLVYLPRWYWAQIGSPDLTPLKQRGVGLVSSAYPRSASAGTVATYTADGGDAGEGWAAYGNVAPVLWQFADDDPLGGKKDDINAFRGTAQDFAAWLGATVAGGSPHPAQPPTLTEGSKGAYVHQLQRDLTAHGFPCADDGDFGGNTLLMVRAFQTTRGITVDGVVGPITWGRLTQPAGSSETAEPTLALGAHGIPVERMQTLLLAHGFDPHGLDGKFGPDTLAVVERFQQAKGLKKDGIVGVHTWYALTH
jgi:peptidoglycan hydrolase-like protein with peptidoglycan-binding domain